MLKYSISATKEFTWDMAHMLAGHEGLCQNLHGHTYKMEVTVVQKYDDVITDGPSEGMVVDFKDLKNIVNDLIVKPLDHATILNITTTDEFEIALYQLLKAHGKKIFTVPYRPTAENMAVDFFVRLNRALTDSKSTIKVTKIKLYETPTSYAEITE